MRFFLSEYAKKFASIMQLYPKERLWFQNKCVPLQTAAVCYSHIYNQWETGATARKGKHYYNIIVL